jgi:hypothetical protein
MLFTTGVSRTLAAIFCITLSFFVGATFSLAVSSQTIHSTVRIPICGDLIAEPPEECDNTDLASSSCRSLGYDTGELQCDIGCEFDETLCTGVAPLPTPTPTATNTPTPLPEQASLPSPTPFIENVQPTPQIDVVVANAIDIPFTPEVIVRNIIPQQFIPLALFLYDANGDGVLSAGEFLEAARSWVSDWRKSFSLEFARSAQSSLTCDINTDESCDVKDFSILLYYSNEE